jgi:hypothetical protein
MGALQNLEKGNVIAALNDIVTSIKSEFTSIESEFPELGTFISQFDTDFGKAALTAGKAFVADIKAGTVPLLTAAEQLVEQVGVDAFNIAKTDALAIAGNALGVLVRAPAPAADPVQDPATDTAQADTAGA